MIYLPAPYAWTPRVSIHGTHFSKRSAALTRASTKPPAYRLPRHYQFPRYQCPLAIPGWRCLKPELIWNCPKHQIVICRVAPVNLQHLAILPADHPFLPPPTAPSGLLSDPRNLKAFNMFKC